MASVFRGDGEEEKDTERQAQAEFEHFVSRAKSADLLQVG